MGHHLFVDVAAKNLSLVTHWMGTEEVICIERDGQLSQLVGSAEIPCGRLVAAVLALHEVPSVICIGRECPVSEISLETGSTVEGGIGVPVVGREVEESIDATVERRRETVGHNVPLVVALNEEEATHIVGIGLRFEEVAVLPVVPLHVAMGIQAIVAL